MDVAFYMTTKALITIERDISDPQLLNAFLKAHGKKKQNHHEVLVPFKLLRFNWN